MIFPENMGEQLSIDETALSKGELYTMITNKKAKGKKGAIVAFLQGTKVEPILEKLLKIPRSLRNNGKEITLDMANSMKQIAKICFPKATQVTDRFHIQKLALEALQNIRIKHRWDTIDLENNLVKQSKTTQEYFITETFNNGDSRKQLLARSRYLLYKAPNHWIQNRYVRAQILFEQYPDLKKAYQIVQGLRNIFNTAKSIKISYTKLAHWYKEVEITEFKAFNTIANTIKINYRSILNYFIKEAQTHPPNLSMLK